MPRLTQPQRLQLHNALTDAFPSNGALDLMLGLRLGRSLSQFAGNDPLPIAVYHVIEAAEAENFVAKLVLAARDARPANPLVTAAAAMLGLTSAPAGPGAAEAIVSRGCGMMDAKVWLGRLGETEPRVCRVEYRNGAASPLGTGVLVAADLVLTNHHVIETLLPGGAHAGCRPQVRFDYHVDPTDGISVSAGREVACVDDWLVASSPTDPNDPLPDGPDAQPDNVDVALLRLAEPVGNEPVGAAPLPGAPARGWIRAPANPQLAPAAPLFVLQHPLGNPLKLDFASPGVRSVNGNGTRFLHLVNTQRGSSGSPTFDCELNLIGLHHWGFDQGAAFNRAIPVAAIRRFLASAGMPNVL